MTLIDGQFYTVKVGRFKGMTGRYVVDHYCVGSREGALDFNEVSDFIALINPDREVRKATAKEELKWRRIREDS